MKTKPYLSSTPVTDYPCLAQKNVQILDNLNQPSPDPYFFSPNQESWCKHSPYLVSLTAGILNTFPAASTP